MVGRIPVMDVNPVAEGGRYAVKAAVDEPFSVTATIFREGHDELGADVVLTDPAGVRREPVRMHPYGSEPDQWRALVAADEVGAWTFAIESWGDPLGTWLHTAEVKVPAGIDVDLVFTEGAGLVGRVLEETGVSAADDPADHDALTAALTALEDRRRPDEARLAVATSPEVRSAFSRHPLRELLTVEGPHPVFVDRERALYGSWYEFFPRSEGAVEHADGTITSGTFRTAAKRLDAVAAMGFDVIYLPPIHPIGTSFRKGPNNTLTPGPGDPGSPWAIGGPEGGHDAIHPDLGDEDDFDAFVARAGELGLEVALDLALQASPDHPWVTSHPEWFAHRADGSIAYAENPPKKYQDIYPISFDGDPEGIYAEVERLVRLWMSRGVRIFRVDNPHTKPVEFWQWLLGRIRETDPDVIFLAEAFTRPAMMRALGTVGFHQSYTYFTWRVSRWELTEYLTEMSQETAHVMRPNFFVNTPDILPVPPAADRPRAVRGAGDAGGARLPPPGACTPGSSSASTSPWRRARRSTSTPRSSRSGSATGTPRRPPAARWRRTSPGSTRSAAPTRLCSGCATSTVHGWRRRGPCWSSARATPTPRAAPTR